MVIQRSVAYRTWVKDLLANPFVKQEGFNPSFVKVGDKEISRVNLLATVVSKFLSEDGGYGALTLDDGTETIRAKAFGPDVARIKNVKLGALAKIIGKLRRYEEELYLSPEIVREETDPNWFLVRKLEMGEPVKAEVKVVKGKEKEEIAEVEEAVEEEVVAELPSTKIANLIKELDKGEGADLKEIIKESGLDEEEAKNLIVGLLKSGDAFEPRKGFLKLLE